MSKHRARFANSLFGLYNQFKEGIKNIYIHPPGNRHVAIIEEIDGICRSYHVKIDNDYQPKEFSHFELTDREKCKKISDLFDKIGGYSDFDKTGIDATFIIYREGNKSLELMSDQPGLQKLLDELFEIDGVLKYWD